EGGEGEDVRRFPGGPAGGEPAAVELPLQRLGEAGVRREHGDPGGVPLGEAGEKSGLRERPDRVRHEAPMIRRRASFLTAVIDLTAVIAAVRNVTKVPGLLAYARAVARENCAVHHCAGRRKMRTHDQQRFFRNLMQAARRSFLALAAVTLVLGSVPASADNGVGNTTTVQATAKLAPDLQQALTAASVANLAWAKDTASGRMVKVLVIGFSTVDPDLTGLRSAIVSAGGSVYYKFISVNAVYALLPASRVVTIAQRSDVESISPNRLTVRTRSLVQSVSGSYESNGAGAVVTPGVDGTGVGIAFLDSGIMATHKAFLGAGGASRVKRSVDMMNDSDVALHGAKE